MKGYTAVLFFIAVLFIIYIVFFHTVGVALTAGLFGS